MFSTVSRKLKGRTKTGDPIQIFTPAQFDSFLGTEVFQDRVPVKRIHVVADMAQFFDSSKNPHTRGLGHQGWRPGHILKSQRVRMLERLQTEDPKLYNEMLLTNSLVIPDASAAFVLEDIDILRDMCKGHDGKNPNHVIRFVWCPLRNRSVVQYKHFCFDEAWRPTMAFNRETGRWETNANVTYSWFNDTADLETLMSTVAKPKAVSTKEISQKVVDNISLCVGSMANFSSATLQEWTEYFGKLKDTMENSVCDIPVLSARQIVNRALISTPATAARTSGLQRSTLRLTSVLHADDRETMVCSDQSSAEAWSNNMMDTRLALRITRKSTETGMSQMKINSDREREMEE